MNQLCTANWIWGKIYYLGTHF